MGRLRLIVVLGALTLALAPAALAAGGAAQEGYGGQGNTQEQVSGQGAGQSLGAKGGLPFTGLDLALLVVGGAVLIIVGATLRRAGRRNA